MGNSEDRRNLDMGGLSQVEKLAENSKDGFRIMSREFGIWDDGK
jgi:hypothetical protein